MFKKAGPYEMVDRARTTRSRPSPIKFSPLGLPNKNNREVIVSARKVVALAPLMAFVKSSVEENVRHSNARKVWA